MVTQVKRASCGLGAVYLGRHTRKARDCCARAIFVPGEPAAAFAQMLLERLAIARDDSQSSTRQGELGGAVPSADFAIIVVDLL